MISMHKYVLYGLNGNYRLTTFDNYSKENFNIIDTIRIDNCNTILEAEKIVLKYCKIKPNEIMKIGE